MKNALRRLHDVVFTPSIRWYRMPRPDVRYPRYPSPASEPVDYESKQMHYKTAFRDSYHMIRYLEEFAVPTKTLIQNSDPLSDNATDKLIRFGFLNKEQVGDANVVSEARKQYENLFGESVDVNIYSDSVGIKDKPIDKNNRESVAYYVRSMFQYAVEKRAQESWLHDLDDIYKPTFYHFTTYDCAADDAVFRQLKLDLEYMIEEQTENRLQDKDMPVFKGDPSFWVALDNSFSAENIALVQTAIKDKVNNLSINVITEKQHRDDFHGVSSRPYPIQSNLE